MRDEAVRADTAISRAETPPVPAGASQTRVLVCLTAIYLIWGSGYLATFVAIQSIPIFLMAGSRLTFAGTLLYFALRLRGFPRPSRAEWMASAQVSLPLVVAANGACVFGQQWVDSGLTAVLVATSPLWTVLFAGFFERWPTRSECIGLAVGFIAILLLNTHANLRVHPLAAVALLISSASWGFGSVLSRHARLPPGAMGSATMMLQGGSMLLAIGLLCGQRLTAMPNAASLAAMGYLTVFSSLIGFSAFTFLLRHTRPAVALSHAYVNPVVAVALGALLNNEPVTRLEIAAVVLISLAVIFLTFERPESPRFDAPAEKAMAEATPASAG